MVEDLCKAWLKTIQDQSKEEQRRKEKEAKRVEEEKRVEQARKAEEEAKEKRRRQRMIEMRKKQEELNRQEELKKQEELKRQNDLKKQEELKKQEKLRKQEEATQLEAAKSEANLRVETDNVGPPTRDAASKAEPGTREKPLGISQNSHTPDTSRSGPVKAPGPGRRSRLSGPLEDPKVLPAVSPTGLGNDLPQQIGRRARQSKSSEDISRGDLPSQNEKGTPKAPASHQPGSGQANSGLTSVSSAPPKTPTITILEIPVAISPYKAQPVPILQRDPDQNCQEKVLASSSPRKQSPVRQNSPQSRRLSASTKSLVIQNPPARSSSTSRARLESGFLEERGDERQRKSRSVPPTESKARHQGTESTLGQDVLGEQHSERLEGTKPKPVSTTPEIEQSKRSAYQANKPKMKPPGAPKPKLKQPPVFGSICDVTQQLESDTWYRPP